ARRGARAPVARRADRRHDPRARRRLPPGDRVASRALGRQGVSACTARRGDPARGDAFDAMTHEQPWRAPLPPELACEEIDRGAGGHFDPELTAVFLTELSHPGPDERPDI